MLKIEQKENRKVNRKEKRKRDEKKLSSLLVILTQLCYNYVFDIIVLVSSIMF